MQVCIHFDSERQISGVRWADEADPRDKEPPVAGRRADQVQVLPNGGVRVTDDNGRLWVGDMSAAVDGWVVLQQAD